MRELLAHLATKPATFRRPSPQRLNMLDQEPPNPLERRALHTLRAQAQEGDSEAAVLQEFINRMARALESYRSHYPPPIA